MKKIIFIFFILNVNLCTAQQNNDSVNSTNDTVVEAVKCISGAVNRYLLTLPKYTTIAPGIFLQNNNTYNTATLYGLAICNNLCDAFSKLSNIFCKNDNELIKKYELNNYLDPERVMREYYAFEKDLPNYIFNGSYKCIDSNIISFSLTLSTIERKFDKYDEIKEVKLFQINYDKRLKYEFSDGKIPIYFHPTKGPLSKETEQLANKIKSILNDSGCTFTDSINKSDWQVKIGVDTGSTYSRLSNTDTYYCKVDCSVFLIKTNTNAPYPISSCTLEGASFKSRNEAIKGALIDEKNGIGVKPIAKNILNTLRETK